MKHMAAPPGAMDILLIEDDPMVSEALLDILRDAGYRVEAALSGEEGLERIGSSLFRLVFLDLRLPGMDGLEVLRRLRETAPGLPVVVITGHGSVDDAREAVRLGARDFVMKPIGVERLLSLARDLLPPSGPPGAEAARVLLVEDDPQVAQAARDILEGAGHPVLPVSSAGEAIPCIAGGLFDVLVTDLRLPGGGGRDLIQQAAPAHSMACLAISGSVDPEEVAAAMRLGAHDVITKPFAPEALLRGVAGAHRAHRLARLGLQPGTCYRVEGESPHLAYGLLRAAVRAGLRGLCISRLHPLQVHRRYSIGDARLQWLGGPDGSGPAGIGLGNLVKQVSEMVESGAAQAVLLDGVEYLAAHHGFSPVLRSLEALRDTMATRGAILLLPVDPQAFDPREYAMLRRFTETTPSGLHVVKLLLEEKPPVHPVPGGHPISLPISSP